MKKIIAFFKSENFEKIKVVITKLISDVKDLIKEIKDAKSTNK